MTAVTTLTRAEAIAVTGQARTERDRIRSNLLELDQNLGHRILDGTDRLAGTTAAQSTSVPRAQARPNPVSSERTSSVMSPRSSATTGGAPPPIAPPMALNTDAPGPRTHCPLTAVASPKGTSQAA